MKNLLTLTLCLFGFAAASAQQVFHGKDYGIVPNTGTDMTQPFVKALADIKDVAALPTAGAIILIIISILLSLIAGLIPSRIASKKDPVEALRSE